MAKWINESAHITPLQAQSRSQTAAGSPDAEQESDMQGDARGHPSQYTGDLGVDLVIRKYRQGAVRLSQKPHHDLHKAPEYTLITRISANTDTFYTDYVR